jgi:hypothetical protein
MDEFLGLPAHPLMVHIPVAMLPLAAIGVAVMLVRRAWYERYKWAVLAVGAIGTVGAIIATSTGEELEHRIGEVEGREAVRGIHEHAEAGDLARTLAIVFFVALAAYVLVPWFLDRRGASAPDGIDAAAAAAAPKTQPAWLRPVLMAFVALAAVASMVSIIEAGHSGASRAWEDLAETSTGG